MGKIKSFFKIRSLCPQTSVAMLLVRLVMGLAFILHGWGKIQAPMSWMPPEAGVPAILQFLAALSEFGGGIALILGLLTRLATVGLFCTMLVATILHAVIKKDPFVSTGGGSYELALLYLVLSYMFFSVGPGKFSADKHIFGERS